MNFFSLFLNISPLKWWHLVNRTIFECEKLNEGYNSQGWPIWLKKLWKLRDNLNTNIASFLIMAALLFFPFWFDLIHCFFSIFRSVPEIELIFFDEWRISQGSYHGGIYVFVKSSQWLPINLSIWYTVHLILCTDVPASLNWIKVRLAIQFNLNWK